MRDHITCKNLNGAIINTDMGYPLEQGFFDFIMRDISWAKDLMIHRWHPIF